MKTNHTKPIPWSTTHQHETGPIRHTFTNVRRTPENTTGSTILVSTLIRKHFPKFSEIHTNRGQFLTRSTTYQHETGPIRHTFCGESVHIPCVSNARLVTPTLIELRQNVSPQTIYNSKEHSRVFRIHVVTREYRHWIKYQQPPNSHHCTQPRAILIRAKDDSTFGSPFTMTAHA
jgi:hypothetical protein